MIRRFSPAVVVNSPGQVLSSRRSPSGYPYVPAAAFVSLLVLVRMLVLALAAPYGFYFYSTSLYLVGLLIIVPSFCLEWKSRRLAGTL